MINENACIGNRACKSVGAKDITTSITIEKDACHGAASCREVGKHDTAEVVIQKGACTSGNQACYNCMGEDGNACNHGLLTIPAGTSSCPGVCWLV